MYIEIESEEKSIPQITFKRERARSSNIIKKSEIQIFHEAKALLLALEDQVQEYQDILEQQVVQMIEDKESALNEYVEKAYDTVMETWIVQQDEWFERAQYQLSELLSEQENYLKQVKDELKLSVANAVTSRLTKLNQSEHLIGHLIEVLHSEIDDEAKKLSVEQQVQDDGVILTIENEDTIISVNTSSIIAELRASLKQL
ncbi:hypothetical protein [Vibrio sagamiensis]|uniref:Uncharacterized protein n=1 Tax=Vibrio sagamiensis NBRC 104589 TaxID=1219064 RepID=A0A511QJF2_9VIBR|nr:hypothetical protein [Vibrio sagamiensis]PNQ54602.1 hypothetical protein C1141_15050 [Vibrio agarivorans]GEM77454.1 hypothetical protein VSA01S_35660 [Vibrio sagamiensis NBRC 104589]